MVCMPKYCSHIADWCLLHLVSELENEDFEMQ